MNNNKRLSKPIKTYNTMKVTNETMSLRDFEAWSGAVDTKETIINEGKAEQFDSLIEDLYPDGLTDTQLNDFLWFEEDWIFETLGIEVED